MPDQQADCIFCRIARGEIPAQVVRQNDDAVAFRDLNPQAPTHVLVIPRRHIGSLHEAGEADAALLGRLLLTAREVAEQEGLGTNGYRVVINHGPDAGQSVPHLHLHVLGGRPFAWPPG
ncbi:MAG TPA: histidine triad nucleotide-binding protein [Thermomicrobiales bacterium]|nr:histidine triad nucleotide-binding protein [Thermomicrobiales bacterium]